ncbi:UDP-N-acetylmuramoyl-L-alanine--D-glutamate ligase [Halalkalibacter akibai]|uniref:UDP-N-acetylmuramoylalanine--D-glutamate ligase n=1 Tax=Halalkalibacter akibai (strain ATCC 43226 / DSM 21942 / CIP 109018 / JCM 9157 / 1139) TaxID=1236973 RepID=W4QP15_HALA3|nr:UDP-N-acetylmuramoyl-L-alanine--D-glutamate ligase [Halalkalibacter akibai]GAE33855.1 UDP-N-acetylmuramoylalanine-D-glutamate ligase [Halalkalibacter akibai JCM 9157]
MTKQQYNGKNVLVLGLAKSGEAAAKLLHRLGASVTINDAKPYGDNSQAQKLEALGMTVICGHHPLELLDQDLDFIVKNPGIPYHNPIVNEAITRGIPVVTEIELAAAITQAEIVAITGSNGKTTTTTLIFEMLKNSKREPLVAGNIGTVACEVAEKATENNVIVLEVSSFQLLGTEKFAPKVSVFLNLFDAHLDYHGTRSDYQDAKARVTVNQTDSEYLVYNADDTDVSNVAKVSKANLIPFSTRKKVDKGLYVENNVIFFDGQPIIGLEKIVLPGKHNIENVLAAIGASLIMGAEIAQIQHVLQTFTGVEHRLQFVKELDGRRFYNDSKATNILASQKALEAFNQPTILLAGGLDRGNEFDELKASLSHVKVLITFGETKDKLTRVATEAGVKTIIPVENMEEAVSLAYEQSLPGDVVLLSPACASWDQYKTFEERGKRFVEAVESLSV